MKGILLRKTLVYCLIFLLIGSGVLPIINANIVELSGSNNNSVYQKHSSEINECMLDMQFIYNLTENLSNIIFTEYNESAGEIAKGRAFGSKGEHRAAEILYENMTKLGLKTTKEQIKNIENNTNWSRIDPIMYPLSELTYGYQALEYRLILTNISNGQNETVECEITPILTPENESHEDILIFNYTALKIIDSPRTLDDWKYALAFDKKGQKYVFIEEKDGSGIKSRNPNVSLSSHERLMRRLFYPIRSIVGRGQKIVNKLEKRIFYDRLNHCKGIIRYDFTPDTHHAGANANGRKLPFIYINGTVGNKIIQDMKNFTIDYYIKQQYNKSIISYNVIGELNPNNSDKTVIVCCLYDSGQCQGTGDSAIGMSIVMGVAKYFTENNIEPEYNVKFIGFCGEEAGNRGARYYEATHRKEDIIYVIDVNQVGLLQMNPKLTLNVIGNRLWFINEIWEVVKRTDYEKIVGHTSGISKRWWPEGVMSDQYVFNHRCPTVCFLEDFPWVMHHKDGLNHYSGDALDQFDWNDTMATGEIVLNVTKYLTVESEEQITTTSQDNYFLSEGNRLSKYLRRG